MKITQKDAQKWKENTLQKAKEMSLDNKVLDLLEGTTIEIIPSSSGKMFYGWANFGENKVQVYEKNPSKYLPKKVRNIWNQSGMDHELIGHLYNHYSGKDGQEENARKTQIKMAEFRSKESLLWGLASYILPKLLENKK